MPIVRVFGVPDSSTQDVLAYVNANIITYLLDIEKLGLRDRRQVTVFFPADRLKGNSEAIAAYVTLFDKPERTADVLADVARAVGSALGERFSWLHIEVFITPFDQVDGYWSHKPVKKT